MKKFLILFLTVATLFCKLAPFCRAQEVTLISAKSAILIAADSSEILASKNERERMGMASTTKIITALTVLSLANPNETVTVPKEAVGTEGSSVYLCEGEKLTVEQLLYALLLASANDAAVALAMHCAKSVESFAEKMNTVVNDMGLEDTHLTNPHGLYDENHYTTAYDLAIITREAMKNELLLKIFSTYKTTIPFCGESDKRLVVNHNKMLKTYDGAIGVKTGFTKKTGRCLVSAASREGLTLICVTLDAPDDWRDHTTLLNYGYENYCKRVFFDTGEYTYDMPLTGGTKDIVTITNTQPIALTVQKNTSKATLTVTSFGQFVFAPVKKGDELASLTVSCQGKEVTVPLVANDNVETKKERRFLDKISDFFKEG